MAYSPLAWYTIDDLIAEIRFALVTLCFRSYLTNFLSRESVTNNRIKSGYENRARAPIDLVPSAGAREGHADGVETTVPGISQDELEDGVGRRPNSGNESPAPSNSQYISPQSQIPHLRV